MGLSDLTTPAVNQAIQEFGQLKRKAFLKNYGFGQARDYLIVKDGRTYDSKAIAGAAHGYLPGGQPLKAKDFSGGEATVKKKLEELGSASLRKYRRWQVEMLAALMATKHCDMVELF